MRQGKTPRLLDEDRDVMRLHHYSIHTERAYRDRIKRYILHHRMASRKDLKGGEGKIEAFLTHLVLEAHVASSTQNQVMNALVFLYKKVLKEPLTGVIDAVLARRKINVPVVVTREEVAGLIPLLNRAPQLIVKLLYRSRLRIMEALRLRVHDIDPQSLNNHDLHPRSTTRRARGSEPTGRSEYLNAGRSEAVTFASLARMPLFRFP